jgi:hypothetical protein
MNQINLPSISILQFNAPTINHPIPHRKINRQANKSKNHQRTQSFRNILNSKSLFSKIVGSNMTNRIRNISMTKKNRGKRKRYGRIQSTKKISLKLSQKGYF